MPDPTLISVLMPAFNAEETIDNAISSILEQTDPDFEFIIVDDGSTDGTRDHIGNFARQDRRIRPFFKKHEGIVFALSLGLQQTNGAYIARMDADDISLPRRLELQRAFLDDHPNTGLVACQVEHLGDSKAKAGYAHYVEWTNSMLTNEEISLNRFVESPLAHPSVMFRKDTVERYGAYRPGPFPEDYELWLRLLERGIRMEKIPEVLLQWRDEPLRLSRTHKRYSMNAFYTTKAKYLSRWLEAHNAHHPDVLIWGAGRTSRQRAELLTNYGVNITHYVDVDPKKVGNIINGRPVLGCDDIPEAGSCFIISYCGLRGVNEPIYERLVESDYTLGKDFIFAA